MPPRHRLHDRQPQPAAFDLARLAALEAVEHALALLARDARPVVVDAHLPAARLGLHAQLDMPATVFHRVVEQVAHGAAQRLRVAAQGRAMIDTFKKNGRPVRHIHLDKLDEESLGELLMHMMLETILTGYAMGVDPFDQPAVEEAKILAKKYLAQD